MGIRRAGLGNFEPRQRQRERHFISEPTTVMHVSMLDGPTDQPNGLFLDQPGTLGSLQETTTNRKAPRGLLEQEGNPKTVAAPTSMTANLPQVPKTLNRGAPFQEGFALMSMMTSAHQNDNGVRSAMIGPSGESGHQQSTLGLSQEHSLSVKPSNVVQQSGPQFVGGLRNASNINLYTSKDDIGNTTNNWNVATSLMKSYSTVSTPANEPRDILENSKNVSAVRASFNIKDSAPAVEFQHQLKRQNRHIPSHRHPIQTEPEKNQDEAEAVSKDAKSWDKVFKILPKSAKSFPNHPDASPSPRNAEILPRGINEDLQGKREISTENGERPRVFPVVRDHAEPRDFIDLLASPPPT